jgi:hypothetical protein
MTSASSVNRPNGKPEVRLGRGRPSGLQPTRYWVSAQPTSGVKAHLSNFAGLKSAPLLQPASGRRPAKEKTFGLIAQFRPAARFPGERRSGRVMHFRCSTDCQAMPRPRRAAGVQLWCLTNTVLHSLATAYGSALALGCAGRPGS